jgi:5-methylcytosine-specific restriction endonuclease McrA
MAFLSTVSAAPLPTSTIASTPVPPCASPDDVEQLGDRIAELAARIHAATYELLVLIHQFDTARGWHDGFASCAHWLHWRTSIDLGAAREKVRVARALATLPRIGQAMRQGRLSYSKVRAVTRIATSETEARLLDLALAGTTDQVERVVRAWRRVDRVDAARKDERRHLDRELTAWVDEDGMLVIRGRLAPEAGAVLLRALDVAAGHLFRESVGTPPADSVAEEVTSSQRRADALARVAESALAHELATGTAADTCQVVLHVDGDALCPGSTCGQAVLEETGHDVSAETSRRLACDAATVVMRHAPDGGVLDVGRKTRTIPPAIRRALQARDRRCRFPGCTARHCDAHHLRHWADGGVTRLDNLVLLCRRHHRAVHEGGITPYLMSGGDVEFRRADGRLIERAPRSPEWDGAPLAWIGGRSAQDGIMGPQTALPAWRGERLDVVWAIDVLRPQTRNQCLPRAPTSTACGRGPASARRGPATHRPGSRPPRARPRSSARAWRPSRASRS